MLQSTSHYFCLGDIGMKTCNSSCCLFSLGLMARPIDWVLEHGYLGNRDRKDPTVAGGVLSMTKARAPRCRAGGFTEGGSRSLGKRAWTSSPVGSSTAQAPCKVLSSQVTIGLTSEGCRTKNMVPLCLASWTDVLSLCQSPEDTPGGQKLS